MTARLGPTPALLVLFLVLLAAAALRGDGPRTVLTVPGTALPVAIDGLLDEPAWQAAQVIEDLVQQEPKPGGPTPFHTRVRLLAGRDGLFLGFECDDPNPRALAVHTMQRDGDMSGDDSVAFVLDTFGDRRSGFYFRVNAAGARQDGLISNPQEPNIDWDGTWAAAARRTATGWTAEVEIPAQTLRFRSAGAAWGFNVERYVAREQLTLRWQGISLDSKLVDLRRAGELAGLSTLRQGRGVAIAPYAVGTYQRLRPDDGDAHGNAGLDLTYNVTPELAGIVTVRTDFAETEVDARQVNLTRFPLFFPEKRAFFLEGSNQFAFASGLDDGSFVPFFSRRVGLFRGREVPINAGAKVLGRAGAWEIAALDVETRSSNVAPATNLFAGRVSYDATSHLRLGAIGTQGDPDGVHDNSLAGADATWRTSNLLGDKNLVAGLWGAQSGGDVPSGRRTGWGFQVDYPNDRWAAEIDYKQVGDALDPALGFLPRPGTRQLNAGLAFQPRPRDDGPWRWVRQFFFESFYHRVDDLAGNLESWRVFLAPWNVVTRSGEHLEANYQPQFERLTEPFAIAPGVVIPAGGYRFDRFRLQAESAPSRPFSVSATVWLGDFYDGRLTQWSAAAAWTSPQAHAHAELGLETDFGSLPAGDFTARLLQFKLVYAFTPDLVLSSFTQYDNGSREVGVNNRLRWTLAPGSDLFLVWDHGWERPSVAGVHLIPIADRLSAKLRWTFWP